MGVHKVILNTGIIIKAIHVIWERQGNLLEDEREGKTAFIIGGSS